MRKRLCKLVALGLMLGLVSSVNLNVSAAEDLTTVYITDDPGTIEDRELTTYKADSEDGQYTVIVNGVTDYNKEEYTEKILESLPALTKDKPVKFVNNMFVDSEKYIYTEEGYDSYHCWLASTANMLVISGWNEGFHNPIFPDKTISYEDEIFNFFTASFSDKGSMPENGVSYFLNGDYGLSNNSGAAVLLLEPDGVKPGTGQSYNGCNVDYCSQLLVDRINVDVAEDNLLEAAKRFEQLEDSALAASLSMYDAETKESFGSSHSITITGIVMDNTKTGLDKYVAVIIADSDNEECADEMPQSIEEAYDTDKAKTNSYTMYALDLFETAYDQTIWGLYGYKEDYFMEFANITTLGFKNEANAALALETSANATKDCRASADMVMNRFYTHDDEYTMTGQYELGTSIYAMYQISNRNEYVALDSESAGKDTYQSTIYVYRDDELVGEITDGLEIDLTSEIIEASGFKEDEINLTDSGLFQEPGMYTVKFVPNTNEAMEMYLLNNTPMEETFEVVEFLSDMATSSDADATEENVEDEVATTTDGGTKTQKKQGSVLVYSIIGLGVIGVVGIVLAGSKKRKD